MKNTTETRNILIAVDVQNDFIDGSLAVREGEEVVQPINDLADAVRQSDGTVAFTRDWHPASTPHFETWPVHCVEDSPGAAFSPNLRIDADDLIVSKGTEQTDGYSGWEGKTDDGVTLEAIIAPSSPSEKVRVFIGGLATDYCVKSTALDITKHFEDDMRVSLYLLRDAIRAVNIHETDGDEAMQAMLDANAIAITSAEARQLIEKGA